MKKVKIYITYYSYVQYMEYQIKSFNKFIEDEFEVIILNNSPDPEMWNHINKAGKDLGIKVIDVPGKVSSTANESHAHALLWSYSNIVKNDNEISVYMDSDIFFYDYFNFNEYLEGYEIAGHMQSKVHNIHPGKPAVYFWPGLLMLDMSMLPDKDQINLNCGCIDGIHVDVGGYMWHYLKSHPGVKYRQIHSSNQICKRNNNMDFFPREVHKIYNEDFIVTRLSRCMIHAGAGCNWNNQANRYMKDKIKFIFKVIDDSINEKIDWSSVRPVERREE